MPPEHGLRPACRVQHPPHLRHPHHGPFVKIPKVTTLGATLPHTLCSIAAVIDLGYYLQQWLTYSYTLTPQLNGG